MIKNIKRNWQAIAIWIFFEIIAFSLFLTTNNSFYLYNFSYIGSCITIGLFLYQHKMRYARNVVQFAVGTYMLVYLGIICNENMQIEGFWYYLFLGVFQNAVIHYFVAKLVGPILFGRGFCGYACWTTMILDLLPYKTPKEDRKNIGYIRYITFILSIVLVGIIFILDIKNKEKIMLVYFILGNMLYYVVGIILAYKFKDNRAFCKYICPVTVFLKPMSYFSLMRIKCDEEKCVHCNKCKKICPMNVDLPNNSRKRKNATECILCNKCIDECPQKALHL